MKCAVCLQYCSRLECVTCFAGLVQRFSLGFRGPICLFAGFLGVKAEVFGAGVAVGAFSTMALQITAVRLPDGCTVGMSVSFLTCRVALEVHSLR